MNEWAEIRARSFERFLALGDNPSTLLSLNEQDQLRRISSVLQYHRGDLVFAEGYEAQFIYFIASGVVRISRCAENGQRQILAFRVPGDLFGFPDGGHYLNSAEAVCTARIHRMPWQRVQQMMRDEPQLQLNVLTKVIHNFRQAQSRIMALGQHNAYQRLASFLLDFVRVPEFFDEPRALLTVPVNRFDLADYLGTARQSTARAFARLESEGLIRRITSRTIEILDVEGLEALQCGPRRSLVSDDHPAAMAIQEPCV